jgi:hypothetical protein
VPEVKMLGDSNELNKRNERYPAGQDTAIHEASMASAPHWSGPYCQSSIRRLATSRR